MSLMIPPKNVRLHWDDKNGWILDVPWVLPDDFLRKVVSYSIPKQVDRWRSLPTGEKRDDLGLAIQSLKRLEIRQNVVGSQGNGTGDLLIFSGRG